MPNLLPIIGALAAICTSLSYIPQVRKALPRGSTGDLSVKMLAVLTAGLALWVGYGLVKRRLDSRACERHWRDAVGHGAGLQIKGHEGGG